VPSKLKERTKTIIINPFDFAVKVIVSNDVHASAHKRGIQTSEPWHAMHAGVVNRLMSLIFLPLKAGPDVVAHEVFHCAWHIMKSVGAEFENEVMAYTMSYLVAEILAFVQGKKSPRAANAKTRRDTHRCSSRKCHFDVKS
jgi:hypothetical protein